MNEYDEQPDLAPADEGSGQAAGEESAVYGTATPDAVPGDDSETGSTGVSAVDEVLATVGALDGRPVEEHVAVFEQAHERLRRALDPGHG